MDPFVKNQIGEVPSDERTDPSVPDGQTTSLHKETSIYMDDEDQDQEISPIARRKVRNAKKCK